MKISLTHAKLHWSVISLLLKYASMCCNSGPNFLAWYLILIFVLFETRPYVIFRSIEPEGRRVQVWSCIRVLSTGFELQFGFEDERLSFGCPVGRCLPSYFGLSDDLEGRDEFSPNLATFTFQAILVSHLPHCLF